MSVSARGKCLPNMVSNLSTGRRVTSPPVGASVWRGFLVFKIKASCYQIKMVLVKRTCMFLERFLIGWHASSCLVLLTLLVLLGRAVWWWLFVCRFKFCCYLFLSLPYLPLRKLACLEDHMEWKRFFSSKTVYMCYISFTIGLLELFHLAETFVIYTIASIVIRGEHFSILL